MQHPIPFSYTTPPLILSCILMDSIFLRLYFTVIRSFLLPLGQFQRLLICQLLKPTENAIPKKFTKYFQLHNPEGFISMIGL